MAFGSVFILLAAGLDDLFSWSPDLSLGLELLNLALIVIRYNRGPYAFVENSFFLELSACSQSAVRLSLTMDLMRLGAAPRLLGSLIASLGMPLLLDSLLTFLAMVIFGFFFVLQTLLEDHFLQENLAGYTNYAKEVRYRLFPGV